MYPVQVMEYHPGLAGSNGTWSDMEMHDAMQVYWSKFSNAPRWALWVFFARLHDRGTGLGGIMFDDIGPNHRQGTAIFDESFINNAPPRDPNPAAAVARLKFWTAVHEMGHSFNLAHSWQKNFPSFGNSWIPIANEPEARSFMNYPYNVSGGESSFFSNFEYRFSTNELLFLRHAPRSFVQMGNSHWFVDHGFSDEISSSDSKFALEIELVKSSNTFEYMEPVYLQLKLKNTSGAPLTVDEHVLQNTDEMLIQIEKPSGEIENLHSFVHYLFKNKERVLMPDEVIEETHFISAGTDNWYVKDSGSYKVTAIVDVNEALYVSNSVELIVLSAVDKPQEELSGQYFTEDVARILFFGGSKYLEEGNQVLDTVVQMTPDTNVSMHASVALAQPYLMDYKTLNFKDPSVMEQKCASAEDALFKTIKSKKDQALEYLENATTDYDRFIDCFGKSKSQAQLTNYLDALESLDKNTTATKLRKTMQSGLKKLDDQK